MSKPRDPKRVYNEACVIASEHGLAIYPVPNQSKKAREAMGYRVHRKYPDGRRVFIGATSTVAGLHRMVRRVAQCQ